MQTGCERFKSTTPAEVTDMTLALTVEDHIMHWRTSPLVIGAMLDMRLLSRFMSVTRTCMAVKVGGMCPDTPTIWPTSLSCLVRSGSRVVPTPIKPPGTAIDNGQSSERRLVTLEVRRVQVVTPCESTRTRPGFNSIC